MTLAQLALGASLACAVVPSGCSETPSQQPQPQPSATTSSHGAAPLIEARWRKAPLPFRSALSLSRGGRALQVTLSTHELTCEQLRKGVQMHPDEVSFDLTFAPLLQPDGSEIWAISRARFGKIIRQGKLGTVTLNTESPLESLKAQVELAVSFPPHRLELAGALTTSACGVMPWSTRAQSRKQEQLQVELAGKRLTLRGASLERRAGKRQLRLSTEPHVCGTSVGSDLALDLTLSADGQSVEQVRADGYVLTTTLSTRPDPAAVKVRGISPDMPATGDVQLELDGQFALGRYTLSLLGTVRAETCEGAANR